MDRQNPFISTTLRPFGTDRPLHLLSGIIAGLTIFPIRLVLSVVNILFAVINSYLIQVLRPHVRTTFLELVLRLQIRWQLVLFGFWWIHVTGTPAPKQDAPIIVSNHMTLVDGAFLIYHTGACGLSAIENSRRAVISTLANALNTIWVDRAAGGSNTVDNLRRIASDPAGRQILIFPEGTCGNGTTINSFKTGAFAPLKPVQPVTLRYRFHHFDPSWCNIGPTLNELLLYMMLSWYNVLEVTYHPPQAPSSTEAPKSFAMNVQSSMARALGVRISHYSFDDIRLANKCRSLNLDPKVGLLELDKLRSEHSGKNLSYDTVAAALELFSKETDKDDFREYLLQRAMT